MSCLEAPSRTRPLSDTLGFPWIPPRQWSLVRRPLPWPRQGRRLGPPEVWNIVEPKSLVQGHSSLPCGDLKRCLLARKRFRPPQSVFAAPRFKAPICQTWHCPLTEVQPCHLLGFKTALTPNPSLQLIRAAQAAANSSCGFCSLPPVALVRLPAVALSF